MVVIFLPCTSSTDTPHDRTAFPSTWTVQDGIVKVRHIHVIAEDGLAAHLVRDIDPGHGFPHISELVFLFKGRVLGDLKQGSLQAELTVGEFAP